MGLFGLEEKAAASALIPAEKVTMYRVHVGRRIYGPVRIQDFKRIPGFTLQTPIAPIGTESWKPAYQTINLQQYFHSPVQNTYTRQACAQDIKNKLADELGLNETIEETPIDVPASPSRRPPIALRLVVSILLLVPLISAGWMGWKVVHGGHVEKEARILAIRLIDKALGVLNA